MKFNIKYLISGLGLLLFSASCDNFLDVHPKGEVLGKELLKDRKGVENALYGIYATMRSENLYGKNMSFYTLDILAQYFTCQGNSTVLNLTKYNYYQDTEVKKLFLTIWSKMYENIAYTNNVLLNLENRSPKDLKFHDIYKGEALGLRAYMHFDLLRMFCPQSNGTGTPGIVYNTDFSLTPPALLPKARIWELIIQDLQEAEKLLDHPELYAQASPNDAFLRDQQTHFNLHAVRATLARVYLTKGDYENARIYALKVIEKSGLELSNKEELKESTGCLSPKETIFGLYAKDSWYKTTKDFLTDAVTARSLDPRGDIANTYVSSAGGHDYRWDFWFTPSNQKPRFTKLTDPYQLNPKAYPQHVIPGIHMLKLPEMYYILAECLLRQDSPQAAGYLKSVLESRGLAPAEHPTLQNITQERYKEFIGEGQTFFNMKRLNLDIQTVTGETAPASEAIYTIKIPDEEFNYRN